MSLKKPITLQTPHGGNISEIARVDFRDGDFDKVLDEKGYDVIWESAIKCPCVVKGGSAFSDCFNCGGTGWVMFNAVDTKMKIDSIGAINKRGEWSVENTGMANVTPRLGTVLGYMDRITIKNSDGIYNQLMYPTTAGNKLFAFLRYIPLSIIDVFLFVDASEKLRRLTTAEYSVVDNVIIFDNKFVGIANLRLSVRYHHNVQYHVIDINKEVRRSNIVSEEGDLSVSMAQSVICRRAHYIFDAIEIDGKALLDNSYERYGEKRTKYEC